MGRRLDQRPLEQGSSTPGCRPVLVRGLLGTGRRAGGEPRESK